MHVDKHFNVITMNIPYYSDKAEKKKSNYKLNFEIIGRMGSRVEKRKKCYGG